MDDVENTVAMNGIWITWEKQRRNKGISTALGWDLYEIVCKKSGIYRYLLSSIKTVSLILKEKPRIVAAQNPSIILAGLVLLLKKIFGYKLIIDAHNIGIFPLEGRSKFLMFFSKKLQRYADLTLVTNSKLKSVVKSNKGKAFVLPDKIPDVPEVEFYSLEGKVNIAYICTFSDDEPFREVIKSASMVSEDTIIYFTGKYEGKIDINSISTNIKLLGFIPDQQFWSLLSSVDFIMDLTLREGCLVCGAYEGIALSKPLILSNTEALKSYFNKGCIYVEPTAISIAQGIKRAIKIREELSSEVGLLKLSIKDDWEDRLNHFQEIIKLL